MNVFMSEMITLVRDFDGRFEKNTGDGLMAYFGEGAKTDAERVKPAVGPLPRCSTSMTKFWVHIWTRAASHDLSSELVSTLAP